MTGMIDVHCHILPGIDDGADSLELAVQLLQKEYQDGVRAIILTPHYRRRMFEPSMEQVKKAFSDLQEANPYSDLKLYLGCEYHANMDMLEDIQERRRPTMAESRCVLTEFADNAETSFIRERTYQLLASGYTPIIAHIERYKAMVKDIAAIDELSEQGCKIQVNADSIIGKEGFFIKRFCKKLLDYDLIDLIGSDAHNLTDRPPRLGACAEYLEKKMGAAYVTQLMIKNPIHYLKLE